MKEIIGSVIDAVEALGEIDKLPVPTDTPSNVLPFIADLPVELEWNGANIYEYLSEKELKAARNEDAKELLREAKRYLADYDKLNWYTYFYSPAAQYEGLYELNPDKVDIAPDQLTEVYANALQTATRLAQGLPDRFFVVHDGPFKVGNYRLVNIGVRGVFETKVVSKKVVIII